MFLQRVGATLSLLLMIHFSFFLNILALDIQLVEWLISYLSIIYFIIYSCMISDRSYQLYFDNVFFYENLLDNIS